jgi:hypothetical protein
MDDRCAGPRGRDTGTSGRSPTSADRSERAPCTTSRPCSPRCAGRCSTAVWSRYEARRDRTSACHEHPDGDCRECQDDEEEVQRLVTIDSRHRIGHISPTAAQTPSVDHTAAQSTSQLSVPNATKVLNTRSPCRSAKRRRVARLTCSSRPCNSRIPAIFFSRLRARGSSTCRRYNIVSRFSRDRRVCGMPFSGALAR